MSHAPAGRPKRVAFHPQHGTSRGRAPRSSRKGWICFVALAGSLLLPTLLAAQSLVTLRDVEKRLLESKLREFQQAHEADLAASRAATEAVQALRSALGDLSVPVQRLRQLESQLAVARGVADRRAAEATRLRHDIYDRMERLSELEAELDSGGVEEWGTYSLYFGPDEGAGTLTLRSESGRIEGTYRMETGRRGTVRGSLQGRRLQLERYDSQRGRDRTLEAVVEGNRNSIRGTWVATELASGEQTSGVWQALRTAEEE